MLRLCKSAGAVLWLAVACGCWAPAAARPAVPAAAGPAGTAPVLRIQQVQGSGPASPWQGRWVAVQGVVTGLLSTGFTLQEEAPQGPPDASSGLQVHTRQRQGLAPGVRVRVTGRVEEFAPGGERLKALNPGAGSTTQLTDVQRIERLGQAAVPPPVLLRLPLPGGHTLERYEGMRVTLQGPLTVVDHALLGRYGQLTLSAEGRQFTPTELRRPGPQAQALAQRQTQQRIVLDDGRSSADPSPVPFLGPQGTLRIGDTVAAVTGVIDEGPVGARVGDGAGHRLQALGPVAFQRSHPRTAAPRAVGGSIKVASFNVLNYFLTLEGGRGADSSEELQRQRAKIVAALQAIDADVLGLMEIENRPDAAADLAQALNRAVGTGTYAAVQAPVAPPAEGADAIQVALLYKPARLRPVGPAQRDERPVHHRPPLAQAFEPVAGGDRFSVIVSHFKSKRCDDERAADDADADQGDGQGCFNARRVRQARALAEFAQAQGPRTLLVGDLNAYGQEDPVQRLREAGFVDLVHQFEPGAWTYVFQGRSGRLDHALASPALAAQATGATVWHINADEPPLLDYNLEGRQPACARCAPDGWRPDASRSSDHDPVIVGLRPARAR